MKIKERARKPSGKDPVRFKFVMEHNELLFIYGTLTETEVQQKVLGRMIKGIPDCLKGYKKSEIEIEDGVYPGIVLDTDNVVNGLVIKITEGELKKIDEYETGAYRRERIVLESGLSAWVYIKV